MILALDVEPSTRRGGQERSLRDILVGLAEGGARDITLGYVVEGDLLEDYRKAGIGLIQLSRFSIERKRDWRQWGAFFGSALRVRRLHPRTVYVNQIMDLPLVGFVGLLSFSCRVVCHLRLPPPERPKYGVNQLTLGARAGSCFIVATQDMKEAWSRWGLPARKMRVIPNAFEISRYAFRPRPRRAPGQPLIIGYLGRIARGKGVHVLIEALGKLTAEGLPCLLRIGGIPFPPQEQAYYDKVRKLVRDLSLEDRCEFAGHVESPADFLAGLDVCVFSSTEPESFGRVMVESILCGIPMIAHDISSVREIMGPLAREWIYEDLAELVSCLRRIARDPADFPLEAIRDSMIERYDLANILPQITAALDGLSPVASAGNALKIQEDSLAVTRAATTGTVRPPAGPSGSAITGGKDRSILAFDVEPSSSRGGQELSLRDLLAGLRMYHGADVSLVYNRPGDLLREHQEAGVPCRQVPRFSIQHKFSIWQWLEWVRSLHQLRPLRPEVIYCNQIMDTPLAAVAKALGMTRRVVCHLRLPPPARKFNQIRVASRGVDRFVVANSNMKRAWVDWGLPESRVTIVPNAFRFADFPVVSYGGPVDGPLRIGFLGRVAEPKGPHVLIEAVHRLRQQGCQTRVMIGGKPFPVGERFYKDGLRRKVEDLGLSGEVIFLGQVRNLRRFFEEIDVLVFPSLWNEPFGRVLVESILYGRPVVAHDVGSVREILGAKAAPWIYRTTDELVTILQNFPRTWQSYPLREMRCSMKARFDLPEISAQIRDILLP